MAREARVSLKCAFWCGWSCGGMVVWLLIPDTTPLVWVTSLVYAVIEFFSKKD